MTAHNYWTQSEAVDLCRAIEEIAPDYGFHVALTGGCLYKHGPRKDCDIMFYSIRQEMKPNRLGLLGALWVELGINVTKEHAWMAKATYEGKTLDLFWPETEKQYGDEYDKFDLPPTL